MKPFTAIKMSLIGVLALFAFSVLPWEPAVAMGNPIAVTVDGQTVALDQPAIMSQGRVMVPLRGIFERLGAQVNYDAAQRSITASRGTTLISLLMNSNQAQVNGVSRTMDSPPIMIGSRVLVPLRFVSEALGADVQWQAYNNTVNILSQTGGVDLPYAPVPVQQQQPYQQPYQSNAPFQLNLTGPPAASALPQLFDVTGTTQPNATVRISVISDMPRHGFLGMSSPTSVDVLNTTTQADINGNYTFHVNTNNLASGAHLIVTLSASNTSGGSSNELRTEYSRQ